MAEMTPVRSTQVGAETRQGPPAGGTRKAKAAATEAALKAAALRVFERSGYINAKVTDITTEANRSAGSFYSHFPHKEALLEALLADWIEEMGDELTAHTMVHDLTNREHLRWHVAVVWGTYGRRRPVLIALQQAALSSEAFAQRMLELRYEETAMLRAHLDDMRAKGVPLAGRSAVLASAVLALLEQFCRVWLLEGGDPITPELSDDEAIDTVTDLLLYGLTGPPADWRSAVPSDGDGR
ncbi:TetR/AcrR family transcriptional regulator [Streptosporangium sp. 'caverna']|uniref:TetR/AcrR family transcriptional regulator n=1 Tax=Streptosporangium sp. 'caverna' TaxID=2202249 RepID=UPI000D7E7A57|nr:TetR/AcrR family transcriptional regulator [Streptosporangium sp. 'caverna']AWS44278.1 TetR family transcriptional regulator [Streptosporangium sp. 'caverna']